MPPALKVKQFGLPRWVWLVAIAGGVGVGLYIRARRAEEEAGVDTDVTSADPEAVDQLAMNEEEGLPVGFYDAVSGATLPDAAGAGTTEAFDYAGFLEGLGSFAAGIMPAPSEESGGAATPKVKVKVKAPRGKRGPAGKKGKRPKPVTGGGPPKRPRPKVKVKPKKKKKDKAPKGPGQYLVGAGAGGGHHKKKKKKK